MPHHSTKRSRQRWLAERRNDQFAKRARQEGYASRAVYKLDDIQRRASLLRRGHKVLDVGSAPGGWSRYALDHVGSDGRVIAVDLNDMAPIEDVLFIQGDIFSSEVLAKIQAEISSVDVVLCDACVTIRGIASVDALAQGLLTERIIRLAPTLLRYGGSMVIKMFQGSEMETVAMAKRLFRKVTHLKPPASRSESREVYLVAKEMQHHTVVASHSVAFPTDSTDSKASERSNASSNPTG